jgi:hypothetical protein
MKEFSYAYLVSTSYSGSTVFAKLANASPDIASIGELSNSVGRLLGASEKDVYLCSCGVDIRECPFWQSVRLRCSQYGFDLDLHKFRTQLDSGMGRWVDSILFGALGRLAPIQVLLQGLFGAFPSYRRRVAISVSRSLSVARAVVDLTGKKVFLDTSKKVGRAVLFARQQGLDFRLLHLVRDPRGVYTSYRKHKGDDAVLRRVMRYWIRTNQAALWLKSFLPEMAYKLVRYEDLCTSSCETLEEVQLFLDVEPVNLLKEVVEQSHHIIGNKGRLRPFSCLELDDTWRTVLSAAEAKRCVKLSRGLWAELGYSSNTHDFYT